MKKITAIASVFGIALLSGCVSTPAEVNTTEIETPIVEEMTTEVATPAVVNTMVEDFPTPTPVVTEETPVAKDMTLEATIETPVEAAPTTEAVTN